MSVVSAMSAPCLLNPLAAEVEQPLEIDDKGQEETSSRLLFDHLVGAQVERRRESEAERLGGLEVDYQLELDRGLDWKLVRIVPLRMRSA